MLIFAYAKKLVVAFVLNRAVFVYKGLQRFLGGG